MIWAIFRHSASGLKLGFSASWRVLVLWRTRRVFMPRFSAPSRSLISSAMKIVSCGSALIASSASWYMRLPGFRVPIS